jgi:hypothetical protein
MKNPTKTKGTHSNTAEKKPELSNHEDFILGQGYGSGEPDSEAHEHASKKQYGDNPLPKSGGGYGKAGEAQPVEKS